MELCKVLALGLALSLVGIAFGNPTRNFEKLELPSSSTSPKELTADPDDNEVRWGVINPRFSRLWAPWTYAGPAGRPGRVNNGGRR